METAFRSDSRFTQSAFFEWLHERPRGDNNRYELLGGHIVMTPPAGHPHSPLAFRILMAVGQHVEAGDLGQVFESSAGFILPSGDTVEPDVSFVSKTRIAAGPPTPDGAFYRLVPDLIVEIVSPSTAARDRTEKKRIYEKNGVREYWIVSHKPRQITVYRRVGRSFEKPVHIVSGAVESSVLAGLRLPISKIFLP